MRSRLGTRLSVIVLLLAGLVLHLSAGTGSEECTTLVATGAATRSGGPLLWKNRDTGTLSNKVILVSEHPYSFLALIDADDTAGRMAWAGLNTAGFAIANSASYNLPDPPGDPQDQEGVVMAEALRTCRTVDEFEQLIARRMGPRLGVHANFFAIDAQGGAVIVETHNHGYTRYDAASFPGSRLANTNFSRSGSENRGMGYFRFDRESQLLETVGAEGLDAGTVFRRLARDLTPPAPAAPAARGVEDPARRQAVLDPHQLHDRPPEHGRGRGHPGRPAGRGPRAIDDVGRAGRAGDDHRHPAVGGGGRAARRGLEGQGRADHGRGVPPEGPAAPARSPASAPSTWTSRGSTTPPGPAGCPACSRSSARS